MLAVRTVDGLDAAPDALAQLLAGSADPREAFVVDKEFLLNNDKDGTL